MQVYRYLLFDSRFEELLLERLLFTRLIILEEQMSRLLLLALLVTGKQSLNKSDDLVTVLENL